MKTAYISEIFSSLQGEGIYQGVKQVFIRFAGCNLDCDYCDTPESRVIGDRCLVMGKEIFNPVSVEDFIDLLTHYLFPIPNHPNDVHSVSLTGGEPLLQVDFLKELIPAIKGLGLGIYLETNGTLPEELKKIVSFVDFIAMDIKLPSATGRDFFREHKAFLKIGKEKTFVKIVLTQKTKDEEIKRSIDLVSQISPVIPLVLQPVTALNGVYPPKEDKILLWSLWAKNPLRTVRVITQKQKLWNLP